MKYLKIASTIQMKVEEAMKMLKKAFLPVLSIVLGILSMFFIELFLNVRQTKLLMIVVLILSIILIVYSFVQIFSPKLRLKTYKGRKSSFLLILSVSIFFVFVMYISAFNIGIYEAFEKNFTFSEKIEMYKSLKVSKEMEEEYYNNIESFIQKMDRERLGYIDFYYDKNSNIEHINTIKNTIVLAEKRVSGIFGNVEKTPLNIILYGEEKELEVEGFESDLIQGYFDGENIHIKKFLDEQDPSDIEQILLHEYSHYAFNAYSLENDIFRSTPTWFNEGVAEYIVNYDEDIKFTQDYVANELRLKKLETNIEFNEAYQLENSKETYLDPYIYSYYMIESLIDLKEENIIRNILIRSKDMDFYKAFEDVVGLSIEEYENINLAKYIQEKQ